MNDIKMKEIIGMDDDNEIPAHLTGKLGKIQKTCKFLNPNEAGNRGEWHANCVKKMSSKCLSENGLDFGSCIMDRTGDEFS